jgi:aromatic-L-amino-acid decarboxylase
MYINDRPLEPASQELRALAARVVDLLVANIDGLDQSPASGQPLTRELLAEVSQPPPEAPKDFDGLLDRTLRAAAASYETAGPSYMAYIPGGGIFSAALAEFLAAGLNKYTGKVAPSPALVALEASVLRWLCDLFGFPESAQGLLTTGGSIANLTALVAARTRHAEGQTDRATIYVGEHAHGSLAKAARTAGIAREHLRTIRSTADLRLDLAHLRELIEEDRRAGLIPVCICAAAGTTNTGTVDPLAEVADLAEETGIWLHVDAAYGGFFQLTGRGRDRLAGIERADSITLDPHKSLFLPFGTGALVVRSADALRRAFNEEADYLQDMGEAGELPDFDTLSPELSRDFRGLRLWLPLHLHGVAAFRDQLDEKLDLARLAHETLAADDRFELPWSPDLSVVTFRLKGGDDEAQLRFLERINATQRILLSSTRLNGQIYLRIAILSFRTHEDRIQEALQIISRVAGEVS